MDFTLTAAETLGFAIARMTDADLPEFLTDVWCAHEIAHEDSFDTGSDPAITFIALFSDVCAAARGTKLQPEA